MKWHRQPPQSRMSAFRFDQRGKGDGFRLQANETLTDMAVPRHESKRSKRFSPRSYLRYEDEKADGGITEETLIHGGITEETLIPP